MSGSVKADGAIEYRHERPAITPKTYHWVIKSFTSANANNNVAAAEDWMNANYGNFSFRSIDFTGSHVFVTGIVYG